MSGERDLPTLLRTLEPVLHPETYVFSTTKQPLSSLPLATLNPDLIFREAEGLTLITTKSVADAHHLEGYTFPSKKISLKVHSSLEAVGLMAVISRKLAAKGISSNVVSGYFHDHVFVPEDRGESAIEALGELSKGDIN
ncbi:hypothetical protein PISL3812_06590 [Talaromyces islandicus]|uniref:DUF2241 domain-containing protein n=1 Tax=Talaromyces islandicus TaxID=28573 RepID=A0A0U1M1U2_TALIS|nr:hypothetical protein PISL3812_06590 [Talaromyces islandicus]